MALPPVVVEIVGYLLLFFLVFGMSASLDVNAMVHQLKNSKAIVLGLCGQFVLLPFLGFVSAKAFQLDNAMGMSLLVVTSSPGGSYSNWWCSLFNADLALSVTMTAISTIVAIVMLPLNLVVYTPLVFSGNSIDVVEILDFGALITSLVVVISAICLGIYSGTKVKSHEFHIYANKGGSYAGACLILLSGFASNSVEGARIWSKGASFYIAVAVPCVAALLISNIMTSLAQLKKPERVTMCIECCYQNTGIATSVALSMFQGAQLAEAISVPFFYGMVEMLFIGLYCIIAWKAGWTKAPPSEPFWKTLSCSYEVLLNEQMTQNSSIEIQLSETMDPEEVAYANDHVDVDSYGLPSCLYYCHYNESEDGKIDDGNGIKKTEPVGAGASKPGTRLMKVHTRIRRECSVFWQSLGYKIEEGHSV
mmetsp:Transcript_34080/g.81568  ORF Transcript_34080/g.81568 Transcript_34080/m.81568 type:complete len:421 (+) Transcript_34080:351-1613(+)